MFHYKSLARSALVILASAWTIVGAALMSAAAAEDHPLIAHAHNDYVHKRPLLDALEHEFHSVEADVILHNGKLLVGHTEKEAIATQRTLEDLYLKPPIARFTPSLKSMPGCCRTERMVAGSRER